MANDLIPTTILTGFLGSGKTTLLNKILKDDHGLKIAVIENEFGEEGIDNDLLLQGDEQIVEMNNGCICCTVRGDLVRILLDLKARRDAGEIHFDRVVIETTGLADRARWHRPSSWMTRWRRATCWTPSSLWWTRCMATSSWTRPRKPRHRWALPIAS